MQSPTIAPGSNPTPFQENVTLGTPSISMAHALSGSLLTNLCSSALISPMKCAARSSLVREPWNVGAFTSTYASIRR